MKEIPDLPQNPDPAKLNPLVVLRPGARVICQIKRHPFGILSMYVSGGVAILIAIAIAVLVPKIASNYTSFGTDLGPIAVAVAVLAIVLISAMLWTATTIYWKNQWIVTDDSITQIIQDGLFGRRVSQLSMDNLEDITVDQEGFIQTMLNFGTLRAETAGERSKFVFAFCPNPSAYARKILEVHEAFLHQVRHQPQSVNPVTPMTSQYVPGQPWSPQQQSQPAQQPSDHSTAVSSLGSEAIGGSDGVLGDTDDTRKS